MTREIVNTYCATLPGAEVSDPWGGGHDAWKVCDKMFASVGALNKGVSVKTPDIETAQLLIEMTPAIKAPYFHRSWVMLQWGDFDEAEIRARILTSYTIIRTKLPKKLQATLGPIPESD